MNRYLNFTSSSNESGKTEVAIITNVITGTELGQIRWYGPWRKYCFYPKSDIVFDVGCLGEVIDQIQIMMEKRK